MSHNQTIDGVMVLRAAFALVRSNEAFVKDAAIRELRALLDAKPETVAGHHPACRAVDDYKPGECSHGCNPAVQPQPDPVLCKFYDVTDYPDLVRELVGHVALLQDSAKRNVKPWEDTFPPTLLPAYIERVNSENAAAQPQGEPEEPFGYWLQPKGLPLHGMFHRVTEKDKVIYEPSNTLERFDAIALYAEQPAPVAVVLPERLPGDDGVCTESHYAKGRNDCIDEVAKNNTYTVSVDLLRRIVGHPLVLPVGSDQIAAIQELSQIGKLNN